jgi:hypothetical protein
MTKKTAITEIFYQTVHHFFPEFSNWLKVVVDPRRKGSCTYQIQTLLWVGLLVFVLKLSSRRKLDVKFMSGEFIKHLSLLSGQKLTRAPHNTTLGYLLKNLDAWQLYKVRYLAINELIRAKSLAKFRLFGYYLIAIDGTGCFSSRRRHCPHCLTKKKKGKSGKKRVIYYHSVVEAKLVTPNGFALSVDTEFVENVGPGVSVQDCELTAAYRLVARLGKRFPQLRICLVLDSLYVAEEILRICEQHDWRFIIVFKEGSAPEIYQEFEVLKRRCPENYLAYDWAAGGEAQQYWWVTNVDYKFMGRYYVNFLECLARKKKVKRGEKEETRWLWITNLKLNKEVCMVIANQGGRLRWKEENEGFNIQKNKYWGYKMEHVYIRDYNGMKCVYLFIQLAHILNQLIEKGSLLTKEIWKTLGSISEIAQRLLEELRYFFFAPGEFEQLITRRIQIRFSLRDTFVDTS